MDDNVVVVDPSHTRLGPPIVTVGAAAAIIVKLLVSFQPPGVPVTTTL